MITLNGNRTYFIEDRAEYDSVLSSLYKEGFVWLGHECNGSHTIPSEFPIILGADKDKTLMFCLFNMYRERYLVDPYFKLLIRQNKLKRVLK